MTPEVARAVWLARQYYFTLFCQQLESLTPEGGTPRQAVIAFHQALCATKALIETDNPEPSNPVLPEPPPSPSPITPAAVQPKAYSGNICSECGSSRLRRTGTCFTCDDCYATTGCA